MNSENINKNPKEVCEFEKNSPKSIHFELNNCS